MSRLRHPSRQQQRLWRICTSGTIPRPPRFARIVGAVQTRCATAGTLASWAAWVFVVNLFEKMIQLRASVATSDSWGCLPLWQKHERQTPDGALSSPVRRPHQKTSSLDNNTRWNNPLLHQQPRQKQNPTPPISLARLTSDSEPRPRRIIKESRNSQFQALTSGCLTWANLHFSERHEMSNRTNRRRLLS